MPKQFESLLSHEWGHFFACVGPGIITMKEEECNRGSQNHLLKSTKFGHTAWFSIQVVKIKNVDNRLNRKKYYTGRCFFLQNQRQVSNLCCELLRGKPLVFACRRTSCSLHLYFRPPGLDMVEEKIAKKHAMQQRGFQRVGRDPKVVVQKVRTKKVDYLARHFFCLLSSTDWQDLFPIPHPQYFAGLLYSKRLETSVETKEKRNLIFFCPALSHTHRIVHRSGASSHLGGGRPLSLSYRCPCNVCSRQSDLIGHFFFQTAEYDSWTLAWSAVRQGKIFGHFQRRNKAIVGEKLRTTCTMYGTWTPYCCCCCCCCGCYCCCIDLLAKLAVRYLHSSTYNMVTQTELVGAHLAAATKKNTALLLAKSSRHLRYASTRGRGRARVEGETWWGETKSHPPELEFFPPPPPFPVA